MREARLKSLSKALDFKQILEPIKNSTWLECMPSSKGGKQFIDENRYKVADRTRQKLNDYYSESKASLYKNFGIKL